MIRYFASVFFSFIMQNNIHQATVIAYPIISPNAKSDMEDNVYSSNIGDSNFADDTIEMSGNFFSQVLLR